MENLSSCIGPLDATGPKNRTVVFSDAPSLSRSQRRKQNSQNDRSLDYFWSTFSGRTGNYVVAGTLFFVVAVVYLMSVPNKQARELECMKKFLEVMAVEVERAEKACMTTASDVRFLDEYSTRNIGTATTSHIQYQPIDPSYIKYNPTTAWLDEHFNFLRRVAVPQHDSSTKEITIMSYSYTNSFDTEKNDTSSSVNK